MLAPRAAYDLPTGGKRLLQGAKGYVHTFVFGVGVSIFKSSSSLRVCLSFFFFSYSDREQIVARGALTTWWIRTNSCVMLYRV